MHCPDYVTIVKDGGFNCENVGGRSIAIKPKIVPKQRTHRVASPTGRKASRFASKGNNNAPLLSALTGNVFLTPLRTFRKNGVL